jgi:hypothetical protein
MKARNSASSEDETLLGSNNPAQRVTPGQDDAAMVDLGGGPGGLVEEGRAGTLNQCSSAGRTPVGFGFWTQHSVAVAASTFHT